MKYILLFLFTLSFFSCTKKTEEVVQEEVIQETIPYLEFINDYIILPKVTAGNNNRFTVKLIAEGRVDASQATFDFHDYNIENNECNKELVSGEYCEIELSTPVYERTIRFNNKIKVSINDITSEMEVRGVVTNGIPVEINYEIQNVSLFQKKIKFLSAFDQYHNPITDFISIKADKTVLEIEDENIGKRSNISFPFIEGKEIIINAQDTRVNSNHETINLEISSVLYEGEQYKLNDSVEFFNSTPQKPSDLEFTIPVSDPSNINLSAYTDLESNDFLKYNIVVPPNSGVLTNCLANNADLSCVIDPVDFDLDTITFQYTATDGVTSGEPTTVTINFDTNVGPVSYDKVYNLNEDSYLSVPLEGQGEGNLTYIITSFPSKGLLSGMTGNELIDPTRLVYTAKPNRNGEDVFTYRVTDGTYTSRTSYVRININPINDPPLVQSQILHVNEDNSIIFQINYSDIEDDFNDLTFRFRNVPSNGVLNYVNNEYVYMPFPNYNGVEVIEYEVTDLSGSTTIGRTEIYVDSENDLPIAQAKIININEDETVDFTVQYSDVETEQNDLVIRIDRQPSFGTLTVDANHVFHYVPFENYFGQDIISYSIIDADNGASITQPITINIESVNDIPQWEFSVVKNKAGENSILNLNYSDVETPKSNLTFNITSTLEKGSIEFSNNQWVYTSRSSAFGYEHISYSLTDEDGAIVNGNFDIYIANDDFPPESFSANYVLNEDEDLNIHLLAKEGGVEYSSFTYSIIDKPQHGFIFGTGSDIKYVPVDNYYGEDSFSFNVTNEFGTQSNTAIVHLQINSVNDFPAVQNQEFNILEEGTIEINLVYSDVESFNSNITKEIFSQPTKGNIVLSGDKVYYTGATDKTGVDYFKIKFTDEQGATSLGTYVVNLENINDAPVAQEMHINVIEKGSVEFDLLFSDVDSTSFTFNSSSPSKGVLTGTPPHLKYELYQDSIGTDSFTFSVVDAEGLVSETKTVYITIDEEDRPPIVNNQHLFGEEEQDLVLTFDYYDAITPHDQLVLTITSDPTKGTIELVNDEYIYHPFENANGNDSFTYTVSDGTFSTNGETTLYIRNVNDQPTSEDSSITLDEDTLVQLPIIAEDIETITEELIFKVQSLPEHGKLYDESGNILNVGSFIPNKNVFYKGAQDFNGEDSMMFLVSDGDLSSSSTVSMTINPINDAPVALETSYIVDEDVLSEPLALSYFDVDEDPVVFYITKLPEHGKIYYDSVEITDVPFELSDSSKITYLSNLNYFGEDYFEFKVSDSQLESNVEKCLLTINSVNDLPINRPLPVLIAESGESDPNDTNGGMTTASLQIDWEDVEDTSLTVEFIDQPIKGSVDVSFPYIIFTPISGERGHDSFSFKLIDSDGGESDIVTVEVIIQRPISPSFHFFADLDDYGSELRSLDLNNNLSLISDFSIGNLSTYVSGIIVNNKFLYIGMNRGDASGCELYKYNEAENDLVLLKDINLNGDSCPRKMINIGNYIYFEANKDNSTNAIYKYNTSTEEFTELNISSWDEPVYYNKYIYYVADRGIGRELYRYNIDTLTEENIYNANGSSSGNISHLALKNEKLYFIFDEDLTNNVSRLHYYNISNGTVSAVNDFELRLDTLGEIINCANSIYIMGQEKHYPEPIYTPLSFNNEFNNLDTWTTYKAFTNNELHLKSKLNNDILNDDFSSFTWNKGTLADDVIIDSNNSNVQLHHSLNDPITPCKNSCSSDNVSCEETADTNYSSCLSTADANYSSCLNTSTSTYNSCISTADTNYNSCISDYTSCVDSCSDQVCEDQCADDYSDLLSDCSDTKNTAYSTCSTNKTDDDSVCSNTKDTDYSSCNSTKSSNYNSCSSTYTQCNNSCDELIPSAPYVSKIVHLEANENYLLSIDNIPNSDLEFKYSLTNSSNIIVNATYNSPVNISVTSNDDYTLKLYSVKNNSDGSDDTRSMYINQVLLKQNDSIAYANLKLDVEPNTRYKLNFYSNGVGSLHIVEGASPVQDLNRYNVQGTVLFDYTFDNINTSEDLFFYTGESSSIILNFYNPNDDEVIIDNINLVKKPVWVEPVEHGVELLKLNNNVWEVQNENLSSNDLSSDFSSLTCANNRIYGVGDFPEGDFPKEVYAYDLEQNAYGLVKDLSDNESDPKHFFFMTTFDPKFDVQDVEINEVTVNESIDFDIPVINVNIYDFLHVIEKSEEITVKDESSCLSSLSDCTFSVSLKPTEVGTDKIFYFIFKTNYSNLFKKQIIKVKTVKP